MSDNNQHSPQHKNIVKKEALEQAEVKEVLKAIRKYGTPVAVVIIVVCCFFLFNSIKHSRIVKKNAEAAALLSSPTADNLQTILEDYASTPAGPVALMNLAQQKFIEGSFDEAEALYTQFMEQHGTHQLAAQAELNKILCLEARQEFDAAQTQYAQFVNAQPDSYLAPVALMGKARCLETMNQLSAARQAYEDLLTSYPGSGWAVEANEQLTLIGSQLPE